MTAIKACDVCWKSYDVKGWRGLEVCEQSPDGLRESRRCECGNTLEIERKWIEGPTLASCPTHELLEDSTELWLLDPDTMLLLWPLDDGSYSARKVPISRLMQLVHARQAANKSQPEATEAK